MKLAIIILSGDTPEILFKCLNGIRSNVLVEYKIYLAYNGKCSVTEAQILTFLKNHFPTENYKVVHYGFYNFAALNNDIIRNHLDPRTEYLLFCNNDVIVSGECVNEMVYLMHSSPVPLGTIGCRLLFENRRIQHDGQIILLFRDGSFKGVTHLNLGRDPNDVTYASGRFVVGNTFALCLCRLDAFMAVGCLNEKYDTCFEDVEINLRLLQGGYRNMVLPSTFWAFHLESYSRNQTEGKNKILSSDVSRLVKFFEGQFMNGTELLYVTDTMPSNKHLQP
jgi:GT2 family glycosyltransferase